MGYNFIECNRDQEFLMPPSLTDWIPRNDPVWFVIEAVGEMDLAPFRLRYRSDGKGRAAFDPEMMVALVVYSYMMGERSTRKIEQLCTRDAGFRVLCANRAPDHSTIARFRKDNAAILEHLFLEVLKLCAGVGIIRPRFAAVDGTKIKANASIDKNRSLDDFRRWLRECDEVDAAEDELYGRDKRGDELPEGVDTPEKMRKAVKDQVRRMREEARKAEEEHAAKLRKREEEEKSTGKKKTGPKPKSPEKVRSEREKRAKINTTDPDSRIMKGSKGFLQGYNAQVVVTEDQMITAAALSQAEYDGHLLHPMVEEAERNIEKAGVDGRIKDVVADAGYYNESNLKKADEASPEFFIATKKDRIHARELKESPVAESPVPENLSSRRKMDHKLKTKRGRATFKKRGRTVEPVFGQLKDGLGFDKFMMRGLEACAGEWSLMAATHNLLKLFRFQAGIATS